MRRRERSGFRLEVDASLSKILIGTVIWFIIVLISWIISVSGDRLQHLNSILKIMTVHISIYAMLLISIYAMLLISFYAMLSRNERKINFNFMLFLIYGSDSWMQLCLTCQHLPTLFLQIISLSYFQVPNREETPEAARTVVPKMAHKYQSSEKNCGTISKGKLHTDYLPD